MNGTSGVTSRRDFKCERLHPFLAHSSSTKMIHHHPIAYPFEDVAAQSTVPIIVLVFGGTFGSLNVHF